MLQKFLFLFFVLSLSLLAQDLILDGKDTVLVGAHVYNKVELKNFSRIIVDSSGSASQKGKLSIKANTISILDGSMITADGVGDAGLGNGISSSGTSLSGGGGGSYGGKGGNGTGAIGGSLYDNAFGSNVYPGSRGGSGGTVGCQQYGYGGGMISLYCTTLKIEGFISANGAAGCNSTSSASGGGSGGGILIKCKNIIVSGSVTANGGTGGSGGVSFSGSGYAYGGAGGGGGGRIKIISFSKTITGQTAANGGGAGNNGGNAGQNGTVWYDKYPDSPTLILPASGAITNNKPIFRMKSVDSDSAARLRYKIEVSTDTFKTIYKTYDQSSDSTGWSKGYYLSGDTALFAAKDTIRIGKYQWRCYAFDGYVWSDGWDITNPIPTTYGEFTVVVTPSAPVLVSPISGVSATMPLTFTWRKVPDAATYQLQVGKDAAFSQIIYDSTLADTSTEVKALMAKTKYYWRVRAINIAGSSAYSANNNFTTDIKAETELPKSYSLNQNYPNPFNPATSISFSLPERSSIVLAVYNQLGQRIDVLANGIFAAGNHSISWNAGKFNSGVYFYELKTEKFRSLKKLILLK